ncbi:MAG: histidine phosphatase family protein [Eudoraea sp.]|nr:histidine phosphatase family protein [Eudoraea sp.]
MKQLILVRHGKSSWEYEVGDKDRPLKQRGIKDAKLVAESFKQHNISIEAIYSSPANRALHTCTIFLRELKLPEDNFNLATELYDFSGEQVMQFILGLPNHLNTVMIFGHNYAFTELANSLGDTAIENVPTTGLVHLKFTSNTWQSIDNGATVQTIFPKALKE